MVKSEKHGGHVFTPYSRFPTKIFKTRVKEKTSIEPKFTYYLSVQKIQVNDKVTPIKRYHMNSIKLFNIDF